MFDFATGFFFETVLTQARDFEATFGFATAAFFATLAAGLADLDFNFKAGFAAKEDFFSGAGFLVNGFDLDLIGALGFTDAD